MVQLILPALIASTMLVCGCSTPAPAPGCRCQAADQQPCNRPALLEKAKGKSRGEVNRAADVRKTAALACADIHDGLRACVDACNGVAQ